MVVFSENTQGLLIPSQNGKNLCDFRDPQVEALKWVYSLGNIQDSHLIVLGLGGGHHIDALLQVYPKLNITVLESRDSLLQIFKTQYTDLADKVEVRIVDRDSDISNFMGLKATVVSFIACWCDETETYISILSELSGRSEVFLKYQICEMGLETKSQIRMSVN